MINATKIEETERRLVNQRKYSKAVEWVFREKAESENRLILCRALYLKSFVKESTTVPE